MIFENDYTNTFFLGDFSQLKKKKKKYLTHMAQINQKYMFLDKI